MRMKKFTFVIGLLFFITAFADTLPSSTEYRVCFTPGENCTGEIVNLINQAKKSIYMQGYSFTSNPIAKALLRAVKRGVKVEVILDKSQFTGDYYSSSQLLLKNKIPVWNDNKVNIAHNKVLIIDESIVETGSFNYTVSAQRYNAENVLIIHNEALAKQYLNNWLRRQKLSLKIY